MQADIIAHLEPELELEEGSISYVYDDATGEKFEKGMTLVGNLSVATGVNLMVGLDKEEMLWISSHRMLAVLEHLQLTVPWFATLDSVRATAIADIVFNIGPSAPMKWPSFFHYASIGDWNSAAQQILSNSVWISQVKQARATRLATMLTSGQWPKDVNI